MKSSRLVLVSFVACLARFTPAQQPSLPSPAPVLSQDVLLVPLHGHPDDPPFGAYGLWAAGPDYKASFHDGFTFYPRLGPGHAEHLPVRWQTTSIRIGGHALVDEQTSVERHHTDWRCELRYSGVVEAYDVRRDGVEQTLTNVDLTGAGMPGCSFLVDPAFLLFFSAVTGASGSASVNVPLPDDPLFLGTLYFQWLYVHPSANAAGLITTRGNRTQVRA